ncbi:hypothetical protein, partial [Algiphilus sp.]|uniref:hypothetical protein n=1 Tax=Algiphilus sp. TaxID=1872431 RepID=UPI0032EC1C12
FSNSARRFIISSVIGGSSVKVGRRNPNLNQLPPVTPITYTTSWDTTAARWVTAVVRRRHGADRPVL